jgi:hypothetical protein
MFAGIARARVANLEAARQQVVAARAAPAPVAAPPAPVAAAPAAPSPAPQVAAVPAARGGNQFNGVYSANTPVGVISSVNAHVFATIAQGGITISASWMGGPRGGSGNCTGGGPIDADGAFVEIEVICGRFGDQMKSTMRGRAVATGTEKRVQATFTDERGKSTDVTFK